MKKDAKLIRLEEIEGMLKRVVDYLRNIQKNEPRQDPKELLVVDKLADGPGGAFFYWN